MFAWLAENAATIIITVLVLAGFILAIRYQRKVHKSGGCAGCGNSSGCTHCSSCHSPQPKEQIHKK